MILVSRIMFAVDFPRSINSPVGDLAWRQPPNIISLTDLPFDNPFGEDSPFGEDDRSVTSVSQLIIAVWVVFNFGIHQRSLGIDFAYLGKDGGSFIGDNMDGCRKYLFAL